jgi:hypothetical protein
MARTPRYDIQLDAGAVWDADFRPKRAGVAWSWVGYSASLIVLGEDGSTLLELTAENGVTPTTAALYVPDDRVCVRLTEVQTLALHAVTGPKTWQLDYTDTTGRERRLVAGALTSRRGKQGL